MTRLTLLSVLLVKFVLSDDFSAFTNDTVARVKLYTNSAEIGYQISSDQLPIEFSQEQWNGIRTDTIRLIGDDICIISQTIQQEKKSLNGQELQICRQKCKDILMIDDSLGLVQDLTDSTYYYVDIRSYEIKYFDIPPQDKYIVDFTYQTVNDYEQLYLQMLTTQLRWSTTYDLFLNDNNDNYSNETLLIGYADMKNSGENAIHIEQAELFGGDIEIKGSPVVYTYNNGQLFNADVQSYGNQNSAGSNQRPTVSLGQELFGVYVYVIDVPFVIQAKTNLLLPMISPNVIIERYGVIKNYFQTLTNSGYAQRAYRLTSDLFLPKGNVLVRENNRVVGEISWHDQAANNSYSFTIGRDSDIAYKETVILLLNESTEYSSSFNNITYEISLNIRNFKERPVRIEYIQQMDYETVVMFSQQKNYFTYEVSIISANFTLNAKEMIENKYKVIIRRRRK